MLIFLYLDTDITEFSVETFESFSNRLFDFVVHYEIYFTEKRKKEERKSKIYNFLRFPSEQPVILHDLRYSSCNVTSAFQNLKNLTLNFQQHNMLYSLNSSPSLSHTFVRLSLFLRFLFFIFFFSVKYYHKALKISLSLFLFCFS